MKNEKLLYRLILFVGLGISALVVFLFKNFDREFAAGFASILFLAFGFLSAVIGRKLNDQILLGLSIGFLLFSVLPIGILKYAVSDQQELIPYFHKAGNFFFMTISILSLIRIFKLRLKN